MTTDAEATIKEILIKKLMDLYRQKGLERSAFYGIGAQIVIYAQSIGRNPEELMREIERETKLRLAAPNN